MFTAKLEIKTLTCKITPLDADAPNLNFLWTHLDTFLSYEIQNSMFIKAMSNNAYIRDIWDGREHLFNVKKGTFLTGLLPYVLEAIKQFELYIDIIDYRPEYKSNTLPLTLKDIEIRKYQEDAVDACIKKKRGVISASPRAGKTLIEIMLIQKLNIFPILSVCQSIDVARQTLAKFKTFLPDISVGLIGDGECEICDVTIATVQSLAAAYNIKEKIPKKELERKPSQNKKVSIQNLVETAKVVWVDESHHSAAATYKHILHNKIYAAEYIFGCSGTPFREDNTNLLIEGLLGPIIYEITYSKLIDGGFLVQPTIHMIRLPKNIEIDEEAAYQTIYKQAISDNDYRNTIIANSVRDLTKRGKVCIVLVSKVTHGKALAKLMPSAEFSYSKTKNREQLWTRLKAGTLKCLITTLGDEGIDIPRLDVTVIAAGGESAIKVFQRLRCMTPFEGKKHAIIIDFIDPYKHLEKHSKKREKLYKSEPRFIVKYKEA